jgi:hypothetical protein
LIAFKKVKMDNLDNIAFSVVHITAKREREKRQINVEAQLFIIFSILL